MNLFRPEVARRRADRLSGDALVMIPVSWQIVTYLIFFSVAIAGIFLSTASYTRSETVTGVVVPDKGVAFIIPSRSGTLTSLEVSDGQWVRRGDLLASVRTEEDALAGTSTGERVEDAMARQNSSLNAQINAVGAAALAQQQQLAAQESGLRGEISQLESQIELQGGLLTSARRDLDRARSIADRGYVSGHDLQVREETVLSREQQLSQLKQALASKGGELAQARRNAAQLSSNSIAQVANISASRAQVDQQAASAKGNRAYALRSPISGKITALLARIGQQVTPPNSVMAILPANSTMEVQLSVPSSAIGFVRPGMEVRLAIDAFRYDRFGTVTGKILTVAATSVSQPGPNGAMVPVYPVRVALQRNAIEAYGRSEPLVAGMTLTARIVTARQSLLEWLCEPLFAVGKR